MTDLSVGPGRVRRPRYDRDHPRYKWIALTNTTLGVLLTAVNSSILLISLPAIFRGVGMNPLDASNVGYLLWMLMGYLLATAVLVVMFGRLGDIFGRVRIYNLGFAVFAVCAVALSIDPGHGTAGALWIIVWRIVQGVGGAMLTANSSAILTDAFPANQRGTALGINMVAAVAGSFLGLLIGGVLSEWDWRAVFWVSVPIAVIGAVWSYRSLHEVGIRTEGRLDWAGTITFGLGLTALLTGITYGIQPYGGHATGWTSPFVLGSVLGGLLLLVAFCVVETRVAQPMFDLALFRIRAFGLGNFANLMASIGRGGMQFMLIIWLQGIWLPLHGYDFESTPLWAGIYMLPLTVGFLAAGPLSGWLSDRYGSRPFTTGGALITGATFIALLIIPVDFDYRLFALIILVNGLGSGLFFSPNTAAIMSSVPAAERGAASGMRGTLFNGGNALSMGIFFSLMVAGLAAGLPDALDAGLRDQGVSASAAAEVAATPPVASMFAAFLGFNPVEELLGPTGELTAPGVHADTLTGQEFFPNLLTGPFHTGLVVVFLTAAAMMLLAAIASWFGAEKPVLDEETLDTEVEVPVPAR
ncbi:MFS transporter [Nocardia bovistercoris]|uniref:MFS transporter n=1 Tax=Nocardia bovistercoris TaxID=2785916 RepID=A0A931N4H4_9NOCA|nr:MFS transporter [Nocardia bovistercoris]